MNAKKLLSLVLTLVLLLTLLPTYLVPARAADDGIVWNADLNQYEISSAAGLAKFRDLVNGGETAKNAVLTEDIDLGGISENGEGKEEKKWTPIGKDYDYAYTGTFDGQGHTISGMYMHLSDYWSYAGLFGSLKDGAVVKNLGVSGTVTASGTNNYAGGIAGYVYVNSGSIEITNCYSTCTITASGTNNEAGGIAGEICADSGSATVSNCYSTGAVTASGGINNYVGGIAGENVGTVTNCYSTGTVSASGTNNRAGGIAGGNGGSITNCFYLNGGGEYGTALTEDGFKVKDNFTGAGWDFTTIWEIDETLGRPVLKDVPEKAAEQDDDGTGEPIEMEPGAHTDHDKHCEHKGWTKLCMDGDTLMCGDTACPTDEDGDSYLLPSGSYYLEDDITPDKPIWIEGAAADLCLNGYSIISSFSDDAIVIYDGGTLNLYDVSGNTGTVTHKDGVKGGGVSVAGSGSVFRMYGGKICGNKNNSVSCTGVYIGGAEFLMLGGEISGNEASSGGVYVQGTFTMLGGKITGNKATGSSYGGGGILVGGGTFRMAGGEITGNTANSGKGHNIYVYYYDEQSHGTFLHAGGTVEDCANSVYGEETDAWAVFFDANDAAAKGEMLPDFAPKTEDITLSECAFTLDGSTFSGWNTKSGGDGDPYADKATVKTHQNLTLYAQWGETNADIGTGEPIEMEPGAHTDHDKHCEHKGWTKLWMDGDTLMCGGAACPTNEDGDYYLLPSGSYYLEDDITPDKPIRIEGAAVDLCLNGYSIISSYNSAAILIYDRSTLNLYDVSDNTGTVTHKDGVKGNGVSVTDSGSVFRMYGGKICGNKETDFAAGGVYIGGAEFLMLGGEISGNEASSGGGVYVQGTFTMLGGKITNNKAAGSYYGGGGVFVDSGSTFGLAGGEITGNTAANDKGHNIYVDGNGKYIYASGTVEDCANSVYPENAAQDGYLLAFDPGDGSGTMDPMMVQDNDVFKFPECTFKAPKDKDFDHWEMSGVDGIFDPGDPNTNSVIISSNCADTNNIITVTAHWTEKAAVTTYPLSIGGVQVTEANKADITAAIKAADASATVSGTAKYDPEKNTLTLTDFVCEGMENEYNALYYNGAADLTIIFSGTNSLTASDAVDYSQSGSTGMCFENPSSAKNTVTFRGAADGTLKVTAGSTRYISAESCGISAVNTKLVFKSGEVTAVGGESSSYYNCGVKCVDLTVEGGTLNAKGGVSNAGCVGVSCGSGTVTVSGGTLNAEGGKGGSVSVGVSCGSGTVTVSGGTLNAKGGVSSGSSVGVSCSSGTVTVSGGTLTAEGGNVSTSFGVDCKAITVSGGTFVAAGKAEAILSDSLTAGEDMAVFAGESDKNNQLVDAKDVKDQKYVKVCELETYPLFLGGVQVTEANKDDITAAIKAADASATVSGTAKYDPEKNTLTLDNFSYTGAGLTGIGSSDTANIGLAFMSDADCTIELIGTNAITASETTGSMPVGAMLGGLDENNIPKITITSKNGSGTLLLKGGASASSGSCGLIASDAEIVISGASVEFTGSDAKDESAGAVLLSGKLTLESGSLTVRGLSESEEHISYGLAAEGDAVEICVNGGTFVAEGAAMAIDGAALTAADGLTILAGEDETDFDVASGDDWRNKPYVRVAEVEFCDITAQADPAQGGTAAGGGTYVEGQTAVLTAEPSANYVFVNWTKGGEVVSTDAEYKFVVTAAGDYVANFELRKYTITFINEDGTVLQSGEVAYGETPVYKGATPTKASTATTAYAFAGWTPALVPVTEDATYTATFAGAYVPLNPPPITPTNPTNPTTPTTPPVTPDNPPPYVNPFIDVSLGDYFYDAVRWAVEHGITTGTTSTTFSPGIPCNRAQMVTFLWRAAGSPEPKSSQNPFIDLDPNEYYYKAVLWAYETGLTTGTGDEKFDPTGPVDRAQMVTFLWRLAGSPEPKTETSPFDDIDPNAYYYKAVLWAYENGITTGVGGGKFAPTAPCTRGQIVTFLYRYFGEE